MCIVRSQGGDYWSWFATFWNVEFAFVPIERIAVKHTITIKASITAYSTAVGPSSETRNRRTFKARLFIAASDWFNWPRGPDGFESATAHDVKRFHRGCCHD